MLCKIPAEPQPASVLPYQVYISHCIHEAGEQVRALQQALEAEGVSSYFLAHPHLHDEPQKLLASCRVVVTLATESYGEIHANRFSSFDEMMCINKLKRSGRPTVVVRMCEELALPDPRMHMNISRVKDFEWREAPQQLPAAIVQKILSALAEEEPRRLEILRDLSRSSPEMTKHAVAMSISDEGARKLWSKLDGSVWLDDVEALVEALRKEFSLSEREVQGIQQALPSKGGSMSVLDFAHFFGNGISQSVADLKAKIKEEEEEEERDAANKLRRQQNSWKEMNDEREKKTADLLKSGVIQSAKDLALVNKSGWPALHLRASVGDAAAVADLLSLDTDKKLLFQVTQDGLSALHRSAGAGHWKVVKALLAAGGPELALLPNDRGLTALHLAAQGGHRLAVAELLAVQGAAGLQVQDQDGYTAVHRAAINGRHELIQDLLPAARLDTLAIRDQDGCTCLHAAVRGGHERVARLLVEAGGQRLLEVRDKEGNTCVHSAAFWGQAKALDVLLLAISDPLLLLLKDSKGLTAADKSRSGAFGDSFPTATRMLADKLKLLESHAAAEDAGVTA